MFVSFLRGERKSAKKDRRVVFFKNNSVIKKEERKAIKDPKLKEPKDRENKCKTLTIVKWNTQWSGEDVLKDVFGSVNNIGVQMVG